MPEELGFGDNNKLLFTHFRISGMSLDDGLVSLMADVDVIKLLNYVPGCKEIEVYIKTDVSLVEQHLLELLVNSQSKSVGDGAVIEDIVEDNDVDKEVVETEENVVEEEEEGFDDGDESDLQKDDNELPHT
nr:hypothetical protein [Tanacetum cinerariifolium]